MNILTVKRAKKAGLPPGTPVHIGERLVKKVRISVLDYDEQNVQEKIITSVDECIEFRKTPTVTWVNVDGIHDIKTLEKLGACFDLHPLVLEDIANTDQRPKAEFFEHYVYIVLRVFHQNQSAKSNGISSEQMSIIVGSNFVISFQERFCAIFETLREHIRSGKGRIRSRGPDYLAYSLIDAVVDQYFVILESLGEKIELLEQEVVTNPSTKVVRKLHTLKREMIFIRKAVWPLRELVNLLEHGESLLIKKSTHIYLRDVYDHTVQVIDTIETFRDMTSGMLDIYLSSTSNRLNAIMKVLTIIATIFMPLTFIAGVYGMNFRFMPELEQPWGYPVALALMATVAIGMGMYFRRKQWL
jgi:magnesium transporter